MSQLTQNPRQDSLLHDPIEAFIAEYGAWRVFLKATRAMFRRYRPPPSLKAVEDLSAHVRRDVGLPPEPPSRFVDPKFPR